MKNVNNLAHRMKQAAASIKLKIQYSLESDD